MMGLVSSLNVFILFWIVSSVSLKFSPSFNLFKEFNCIGFIQNIICSYETGLALSRLILDTVYAPSHHDRIGNLEDDDLDGVTHPLLAEPGLGRVGGEAVQEEAGGRGLLVHGAGYQLHHLVLLILDSVDCHHVVNSHQEPADQRRSPQTA